MREKLERKVEKLSEKGADYADIRFERGTSESLNIKDGSVEEIESSSSRGLGIRVLYNGSWGFGSTNSIEKLDKASKKAFKTAKTLSKVTKKENFAVNQGNIFDEKISSDARITPSSISLDQKLALIEEAERSIRGSSDKIKSSQVSYNDYEGNKIFVNSNGSFMDKEDVSLSIFIFSTAKNNDKIESYRDRIATKKGFEYFKESDPVEKAVEVGKMSEKLLTAKKSPSKRMPVVLGDRLGGLFAHEAVGHAAEADTYLSGDSIFKGKKGDKIASEQVSITDDPTVKEKFGSYRYDDEGVSSKRTEIIKNGRLEGLLHSRETASRMDEKLTGNGRAESYNCRPIVRMSNTFFEKGNINKEELIESMKNGIFLEGFKGGQVSTKEGNFTFGATHGYIIKNGETKNMVKNPTISGRTLEVLKKISMVAKNLEIGDPGFCGKSGQSVMADNGAPWMKVDEMVVG